MSPARATTWLRPGTPNGGERLDVVGTSGAQEDATREPHDVRPCRRRTRRPVLTGARAPASPSSAAEDWLDEKGRPGAGRPGVDRGPPSLARRPCCARRLRPQQRRHLRRLTAGQGATDRVDITEARWGAEAVLDRRALRADACLAHLAGLRMSPAATAMACAIAASSPTRVASPFRSRIDPSEKHEKASRAEREDTCRPPAGRDHCFASGMVPTAKRKSAEEANREWSRAAGETHLKCSHAAGGRHARTSVLRTDPT